jgi:hypothetical protein
MGTKRELKIFYRKSTGILLEIILGNIKKKRSKLKELAKGNKRGLGVLEDPISAI